MEVGGGAGAAWAGRLRWHVAGWPGWRSFLVRVLVDGLLLVVFCVLNENLVWDCSLRMLVESVKAKLLVPVFLLVAPGAPPQKASCAPVCPANQPKNQVSPLLAVSRGPQPRSTRCAALQRTLEGQKR